MKSNPGRLAKGVGPRIPCSGFSVSLTMPRSCKCCSMVIGMDTQQFQGTHGQILAPYQPSDLQENDESLNVSKKNGIVGINYCFTGM